MPCQAMVEWLQRKSTMGHLENKTGNIRSTERRQSMNPALGIIIVISCVAVWFLASALYKPIGRFIHRIGKDAIDELKDEEEK